MREINLNCPHERAARDYLLAVQVGPGSFRGPWCLKYPPGGIFGPCCREPGHTGPHIAMQVNLHTVQIRWIEEDYEDEGNRLRAHWF